MKLTVSMYSPLAALGGMVVELRSLWSWRSRNLGVLFGVDPFNLTSSSLCILPHCRRRQLLCHT